MFNYLLKRLLLVIPTLIGIITINFFIIQFSPGGPVDSFVAKLSANNLSTNGTATDLSHSNEVISVSDNNNNIYLGAQGLDLEIIEEIKKIYGFDKTIWRRYVEMLQNYFTLNFGDSLFKGEKVLDLIKDRLPVSISLGLWTTIFTYLIAIPLGIRKSIKDGSKFDVITSFVITVMYAIPTFLFAILLIGLFSKAGILPIFPLTGLVSDNFNELSFFGKAVDYLKHITLPFIALIMGGIASLTILTKNMFLEELSKQYVLVAKSKGLSNNAILYKHVFRNAMIIVISGIPGSLVSILFTSSLLIEIIFSLDGLGLLGYEATMQRDYPVIFSTLFIYSFIGLILNIISDIIYCIADPRINFDRAH